MTSRMRAVLLVGQGGIGRRVRKGRRHLHLVLHGQVGQVLVRLRMRQVRPRRPRAHRYRNWGRGQVHGAAVVLLLPTTPTCRMAAERTLICSPCWRGVASAEPPGYRQRQTLGNLVLS